MTIGAALPYAAMERAAAVPTCFPALAEAARTVGSPQIRAAGTLGGNLGTCSPAGDGLPVLYALDAVVHLRIGRRRARRAGRRSSSSGVKQNVLAPGELITGVTLPVRRGWQGFAKVGVRNAMVIATASACLVGRPRPAARSASRWVPSGPPIVRCRDAEAWLAGEVDLTARAAGGRRRRWPASSGGARPPRPGRSTTTARRRPTARTPSASCPADC